ncbi:DNA primase small subunit domain-containing protein [Candidatus Nanosalina sp. VS9-1]|uniref:DNA primase small subunit domain-containing protein n=1 Tax=Candidatus Nanosalina sp. VS9-1 TaxID=3388566 RepID=UPI0039DFB7B2
MGEREKPQDWKIRQYYEQEELVNRFLDRGQYREVVPTYEESYGQRPDAINFPGDFQQFVEDGAVAFHASVERWRNPLLIDSVSNLDDLRKSWDLVIDIDCDYSFELAKETAKLVIEELRQHGIENISVKFSGNRGFHIGVRAEAFPEKVGDEGIANLYPELGRGIVDYIREKLEDELVEKVRDAGFEEEMETDEGLDPYQVSDIENDWGQRHLFRMPYSLHDGSWLVSLPIRPEEIDDFEKEDAEMDKVDFEVGFLDSFEENEATNLVVQAMDFMEQKREKRKEKRVSKSDKDFERPDEAISEKHFPPTIKNILEGLEDGRKRALFVLVNFYRTVGYGMDEIEAKIWEWNERNKEPLRDSYVKGQLNWHRKRSEIVPPPNYDSNGYYKDMQVYEGDSLEEKVSNPVSYVFRKVKNRSDDDDDEDDLVCPYCGKEYEMESYYKKHVQECFE